MFLEFRRLVRDFSKFTLLLATTTENFLPFSFLVSSNEPPIRESIKAQQVHGETS